MICIQNIYHMLAYAFSVLKDQGYRDITPEKFENIRELCAAILELAIGNIVKRGLGREYRFTTEAISSLHGKMEISESLKSQAFTRRQLVCTYDEFSVNSQLNRIIKATVLALLKSNISKLRKKRLKNLMVFFVDVEPIAFHLVDWRMHYHRNNHNYRTIMAVCWLVAKGLLQTQNEGSTRVVDYLDEQHMCRLYEKFVLEYYRKEHPDISVNASYINWALDDGSHNYLPTMKSDIMLVHGNQVLIIDTKYYTRTMQQQFDKRSIHSANLYQIFTYVKNKQADHAYAHYNVSGLLLYARTDEDIQPDTVYRMSGNQIAVKTLNLNMNFSEIRTQLDSIVNDYFGTPTNFNS